MSVPSKEDGLARERYFSYRKGWMDGASFRAMSREFTEHNTRPDLKRDYEDGYTEGRKDYRAAMKLAETRFGYKPAILRATET